jgi:hypothetical protein
MLISDRTDSAPTNSSYPVLPSSVRDDSSAGILAPALIAANDVKRPGHRDRAAPYQFRADNRIAGTSV